MTDILREEHTHDEHSRISRLSCTTGIEEINELHVRYRFSSLTLIRMRSTGKSTSFHLSATEVEALYQDLQDFKATRERYEQQQEQEYQDLVEEMTRRAAALDGTLTHYAHNDTLSNEHKEYSVHFAGRWADIHHVSIYGIKRRIESIERQVKQSEEPDEDDPFAAQEE